MPQKHDIGHQKRLKREAEKARIQALTPKRPRKEEDEA